MDNKKITLDMLLEYLQKLKEDGKGEYNIVNGEYNIYLNYKSFEVDDENKDIVIWWIYPWKHGIEYKKRIV